MSLWAANVQRERGRYPNGSDTWQTLGTATPGQFNLDQEQNNLAFFPLVTLHWFL